MSVVTTMAASDFSPVRAMNTFWNRLIEPEYSPARMAVSAPYTSVRWMIRSMSYRRCLRIEIESVAGIMAVSTHHRAALAAAQSGSGAPGGRLAR